MKRFFSLSLCVVLLGSTGCSGPDKDGRHPYVKIAPAIKSRVTGLHFDTGDRIGLTIVRTSGNYVDNAPMTYDGTSFVSSDLLWYNDLREQSTLVAYYPYSETGTPAEFTIESDQRTAGCETSDLLAAVKSDVTPGAAPVAMLFQHLMSQLSVIVTNESDATVDEVVIGGFVPTADVDIAALNVQVRTGTAVDVTACEVEADARYRAILVPQQAALTVSVVTSDGKSRSKTIAAASLESGKKYDLAILVTNIDISVTLSGDISDWNDGGTIGEDEPTEGTLEYEGVTYRTTTVGDKVWMADNLRYVPENVTIGSGIWNPVGGTVAVETQGMLYDYATAAGGATARAAGAPVRGICPEGWHIPDADELAALADVSSDFFCCAGYRIVSASGVDRYGSETKGYLMSSTVENDRFNCWAYGDEVNPALIPVLTSYGVSLRCVRD